MSEFIMSCPHCGNYVKAKTGFFAKKKIDCTCGYTINVKTEKMASRVCAHCGNRIVFDQSEGEKAKCPVCHEPVNTMSDKSQVETITCEQCGITLTVSKSASTYTCPVCDCVNDVQARIGAKKAADEGEVSVIKYEGDNDTLIWKHPIEDFNYGSQLIVHESQEAIFFRDGAALDLFTSGRYTLETQKLPLLEKAYKLPTEPKNAFHSEVYFINLVNQLAIKWGTPEKVMLIDPLTQAPISIGARGMLNFRVADSRKLLVKLVGTTGGMTRQQLMEEGSGPINTYFRNVIQISVSTHLANIITDEKLDILTLDQQKMRISAAMLEVLQPAFAEYGLAVTEFLIMGIILPQKGDIGYDALQTIIQMRGKTLRKSEIETETEIKLAEMEAKKQLDIRLQQNAAEVEAAHRTLVSQQGETTVLQAQIEGQKKLTEANADVAAQRLQMELDLEKKLKTAQIEAEEMRLKGYNQKDIINADVQKAYAESIGNMGPAITAGGGSGVVSDMLGLGLGMAAAGAVAPKVGEMMKGITTIGTAQNEGWTCTCGQTGITSAFCPSCGSKKPEPKTENDTWDCTACGCKGITSKFCPDCGAKKPEAPKPWICPECGTKDILSKFCPNCGAKKPETWICPDCGTKDIKTNFCPNCGRKRG